MGKSNRAPLFFSSGRGFDHGHHLLTLRVLWHRDPAHSKVQGVEEGYFLGEGMVQLREALLLEQPADATRFGDGTGLDSHNAKAERAKVCELEDG